jgi:hypothetical protein
VRFSCGVGHLGVAVWGGRGAGNIHR